MKSIRVTISTPLSPLLIQSKPPFLEAPHCNSAQHIWISNMASHQRSPNPPSSATPTEVHPCEFY